MAHDTFEAERVPVQFDFTAFDRKPSFVERTAEKGGWLLWCELVGIILLIFLIAALCMARNWSGLMAPGIIAVAVIVPMYTLYQNLGHAIRLRQFAAANGFSYTYDAPYDYRNGVIFGEGHSQKFVDLLRANNSNFAEIGNYQYITGSGKDQQTHRFGFIRIKLPRKLPNMVLDGKANNTFGQFSNLPESFTRGEKLSLEGDFDQYFTLYAPEQYKVDALYIFTPDVMQALIDTAGNYDCEVIDDDFYIYTQPRFDMANREHFERIIYIVNAIAPEITKQSRQYADENVGDRAANIVAPAGARLKTHVSTAAVIVIMLFVLYFGWNIISNLGFRL